MNDDDMRLPSGKTCRDCLFYEHCKWLFGCEPENTECDWAPSRFIETQKSGDLGDGGE